MSDEAHGPLVCSYYNTLHVDRDSIREVHTEFTSTLFKFNTSIFQSENTSPSIFLDGVLYSGASSLLMNPDAVILNIGKSL